MHWFLALKCPLSEFAVPNLILTYFCKDQKSLKTSVNKFNRIIRKLDLNVSIKDNITLSLKDDSVWHGRISILHMIMMGCPWEILEYNTGCPNKLKGFLGKTGWYFPKIFLISKISCISTSFKKEIGFLSHIAKKLQAQQFSQNYLSEKAPGFKKYFLFLLIFLKLF